ncbi:MAG: DUF393 domain-containing protein [Leptospiraceae bacterium]|nr:DUF393 domain-containing protein [Leptospiraceae bacterium]
MDYFIYDGECPFCDKTTKKLKSLCLDKGVQFISFRDLSLDSLKEIYSGLSLEILERDVQFLIDGIRYPGFFAIRKLSHRLRGYRYFSFLLYIPLVPFLGMLVMYILRLKAYTKSK